MNVKKSFGAVNANNRLKVFLNIQRKCLIHSRSKKHLAVCRMIYAKLSFFGILQVLHSLKRREALIYRKEQL